MNDREFNFNISKVLNRRMPNGTYWWCERGIKFPLLDCAPWAHVLIGESMVSVYFYDRQNHVFLF